MSQYDEIGPALDQFAEAEKRRDRAVELWINYALGRPDPVAWIERAIARARDRLALENTSDEVRKEAARELDGLLWTMLNEIRRRRSDVLSSRTTSKTLLFGLLAISFAPAAFDLARPVL